MINFILTITGHLKGDKSTYFTINLQVNPWASTKGQSRVFAGGRLPVFWTSDRLYSSFSGGHVGEVYRTYN